MDIRQLQYLVALAREKHFTRAAQACHVTQPTLSGRIRQLEQELGVPIVERGQRFHGFTPDGERVLKWAHTILDTWGSLQQEIATLRNTSNSLSGRLSVGVIPTALPMAGLITRAMRDRHPDVELTVLSQSSIDILRCLEDFSIDIGLTYLDNEPIEGTIPVNSRNRENAIAFVSSLLGPAGRAALMANGPTALPRPRVSRLDYQRLPDALQRLTVAN